MAKSEPNLSSHYGYRAWFPQWRRFCVGFLLLGLFGLGTTIARGTEVVVSVSKEYQIKAAFLYNFTRFIEWPPRRFADAASPVVIGVLGSNPFGDELEKIVKGRNAHGRPIVVRTIATLDEINSVHLLFVPVYNEKWLMTLNRGLLRSSAVLTVGESPQFIERGGIISFTVNEDKVRFEIDPTTAHEADLKISSQLLKLATTVRNKT